MRVWKPSHILNINKAMGRVRSRMENRVIWITVLFTIQFSGVLCRNHYYEYYYSRYHKGHSTTEAISSSTSDISYEEGLRSSVSDYTSLKGITGASSSTTDDTSLENVTNSSTANHGTSVHTNVPVLQYGDPYNPNDMQYAFNLRAGIIIGCFVFLFVGSCCLFCCLRKRFRGRTHTGFIIGSAPGTAVLQQPTLIQQSQQSAVAQPQQYPPQYPPQYVDERTLLFPPQYQPEPGQQYSQSQSHYQYASTEEQNHNPPEAPPPYEYPTKF